MMCDPCFMDANQVGYVHELAWEEITKILDDAMSIQPRRQMSVQFSGGEPTLSPHFLDAIRYAREMRLLRRAVRDQRPALRRRSRASPRRRKEAGLRMAYLQFDGIGNEANAHRKIGNLFDVKLRAIEELAAAGIDVILVVTVVNGVNNDQVGKILAVRRRQPGQDHRRLVPAGVASPAATRTSTTRRAPSSATRSRTSPRRARRRPASPSRCATGSRSRRSGPFRDLVDQLMGERADWGAMKCGCHPNCGIGTVLMVNKKTHQMVPLTRVPRHGGAARRHRHHHRRRAGQGAHRGRSWRWRCSRTIGRRRRRPATTSSS